MPAPRTAPELLEAAYAAWLKHKDLGSRTPYIDAAAELGLNMHTFKTRVRVHRERMAEDEAIVEEEKPVKDPEEVARVRAQTLADEIHALVTGTRYPLINPEAIVVKSHMNRRFNWRAGHYVSVESTPRTYVSDTLRVEPVKDPRGRTFIFMGAQNDAEVHPGFWRNIMAYAKSEDADIYVGPGTYETQWWAENNPMARQYDEKIRDYLCFGQLEIGSDFVFAGHMNTIVTAKRPVSSLKPNSQGRWAVYPHNRLQLQSIGTTDPDIQSKHIMSSGYCTKPQVIPRKAGIESIFHHIIGATIVEFDEKGRIFARQINASKDGSFYDLDAFVKDGEVTYGHRIKAMTVADIHRRKLSEKASVATLGFNPRTGKSIHAGSIVDELRPEKIFIHDVLDSEARNHHRQHDAEHAYEMALRKRDNVLDEVAEVGDFLTEIQRPFMQVVVVESNHDLALERYVREARYEGDGINLEAGLEMRLAYVKWRKKLAYQLDAGEKPESFSLLEHVVRTLKGAAVAPVKWVHDGKSMIVDGVECGHHGFRGKNGSRGTASGLAQLGIKMSIGDKHSPEILDGVFVAGVMELQHGYNKGPSGWSVTHIIQYANGKRTLVTLQDGKWRAPRKHEREAMAA